MDMYYKGVRVAGVFTGRKQARLKYLILLANGEEIQVTADELLGIQRGTGVDDNTGY